MLPRDDGGSSPPSPSPSLSGRTELINFTMMSESLTPCYCRDGQCGHCQGDGRTAAATSLSITTRGDGEGWDKETEGGGGGESGTGGGGGGKGRSARTGSDADCEEVCPYDTASWFSKLTFSWIASVLNLGKKRKLAAENMPSLHKSLQARHAGEVINKAWNKECKRAKERGKQPWYFKILVLTTIPKIVMIFIVMFLESFFRISSALLVKLIVEYLEKDYEGARWHGYTFAISNGIVAALHPLCHHHMFQLGRWIGTQFRASSMVLVNRKLLQLSAGSLAHTSTGKCINLISTDVCKLDEVFCFLPFILGGPLEAIVVAVLIARHTGTTGMIAGMATLAILIPVQMLLGRLFTKKRVLSVRQADARVKMTGEVLNGILAVKMFAWEEAFSRNICSTRRNEMNIIWNAAMIRGFNESTYFCNASLAAMVTFLTSYACGYQLETSAVFFVLTLLQLPRLWMGAFFGVGVEKLAEALVSVSRLEKFFELGQDSTIHPFVSESNVRNGSRMTPSVSKEAVPNCGTLDPKVAVKVTNGVFSWTDSRTGVQELEISSVTGLPSAKPGNHHCQSSAQMIGDKAVKESAGVSLKNVSFELSKGELIGITGKVGSGKSTLLAAIMGELHRDEGTVELNCKRISYAAQKPFIVSGSVKSNIILRAPWDEEKYERVIHACALKRDLADLPDGDETLIGERGVNLSGGQKARVGLARAVYCDADLYLLDDPLSAVDPAVGRHLFEECILGYLQGKSVIIVTHQLQYLPRCDRIMLMQDGQMKDIGSFLDLQKRVDLHGYLDMEEEEAVMKDDKKEKAAARKNGTHAMAENEYQRSKMFADSTAEGDDEALEEERKTSPSENNPDEGILGKEGKKTGSVSWRVYWGYGKCFGRVAIMASMFLMFLCQAFSFLSDWFVAQWASKKEQGDSSSLIYMGLVLSTCVLSYFRAAVFFHWTLVAASRIHNLMLTSVFRSPLRFFHTNPVGRILNRFSADQGILDDWLPQTTYGCTQCLFMTIGSVIMIIIGVPWVALILIPAALIFLRIQLFYSLTSREIKRLEGVSRSPVYAHFSETLQGLATIRAFGAQKSFEDEFMEKIDMHTKTHFAWVILAHWFGYRLESICAVIIFIASLGAVACKGLFSPVLMGLALSYAVQISGIFQWMVRQCTEVENMFTSVERCLEYMDLPQEGESCIIHRQPQADWPTQGSIRVENLKVSYHVSLEPVLKGISFFIEGGEKCGIVGRTGAGKSTLMLALFRLVEATEGLILFDDVNIAEIGLETLRRKISAIPQDPVLFGSSVRFNLDPFSEYRDQELWDALEAVRLKEKVVKLQGRLNASMAEFGDNFSVGERQMCCLARAILQKSKLLIMDEATANVDLETDAQIQTTLRERFQDSTVLIIAHRIDTIIDVDKIVVLHQGKLEEFASPEELLVKEDGMFRAMVRRVGPAGEARLYHTARKSAEERIQRKLRLTGTGTL